MFLTTSFWPQNLLCRFLPSGFRQDTNNDVIRYDLEDHSSPVDKLDDFGRFVQCEHSVDDIRPKKRCYPSELLNGRTPSITHVDDVTFSSYQRQRQRRSAAVNRRPTSLIPNARDPVTKKFQSLHNSHLSSRDQHYCIPELLSEPLRNRDCRQVSGNHQSSSSQWGTDKTSSQRVKCSAQLKLFTDSHFESYTRTDKHKCNKNGLKQQDLCSKVYSSSSIKCVRKQCVPKTPRRKHSLDQGFGFLTPVTRARISRVKYSWETATSRRTVYHHRLSLDYSQDVDLDGTNLKRYPSTDSLNTASIDSGYFSHQPVKSLPSPNLSPLISKFETELLQQPHTSIIDTEDTPIMELPEQFKHLKPKYAFHDETITFLNLQKGEPDATKLPIHEVRDASQRRTIQFGCEPPEFDGSVRQFIVPSIKCKAGIPVDIIRPRTLPQVPSIVIYFHGGGMVMGSRKTSDTFCKILCKEANCVVVNVEYRLAPECKYPAPFDDGKCVVRWVKMNLGLLGAVLESKIGVAGESSGGHIAAYLTHEIKDLDFQVLIYPVLDLNYNQASMEEFEKGPGISKAMLEWSRSQFLNKQEEINNPKASPLLRTDFTRQPKTLLIIAQMDPLRDAIYEYKQKLKEADVPVTSFLSRGSIHGFFKFQGHFKSLCDESYKQVIEFVKSIAYWDEIPLGGQKKVIY